MKKIVALLLVVLLAVSILAGCTPVTVRGGGWIPVYNSEPEAVPKTVQTKTIAVPDGKATFGFTINSYNVVYENDVPVSWDVKGNLVYNDHVKKVRIKGVITDANHDGIQGNIYGTYSNKKMEGYFHAWVIDNGEPGAEDVFGIELSDGLDITYSNVGLLGGGNVQLFPSKK